MSNPGSMQHLADRFMNDAQFREEMKQDPEGAAEERSGFQLDDEDPGSSSQRKSGADRIA